MSFFCQNLLRRIVPIRSSIPTRLISLVALSLGVIVVSETAAQESMTVPKAATPFVRPTQYHLLPRVITENDPQRIPTVKELVPVISPQNAEWPMTSAPVTTAVAKSSSVPANQNSSPDIRPVSAEWTAIAPERIPRRPIQNSASRLQRNLSNLRPARVPSKYSTGSAQPPEPAKARASANGLFRSIGNPFQTAPLGTKREPIDGSVQTVNHTQVPVPESFSSGAPEDNHSLNVPWPAETSMVNQYLNEVPCENCFPHGGPSQLFGSHPTAFVVPRRTTFAMDALAWWGSETSLPTLATSSPLGTAQNIAGVPGQAGTMSLFRGNRLAHAAPGYRFRLSRDLRGHGGIDVEFLQRGTLSESFGTTSVQTPLLARPYNHLATGAAAAELLAYPGMSTGSIFGALDSRYLTGAVHYYQIAVEESSQSEDNLLQVKFQVGPRLASLQEHLSVVSQSTDSNTGTSVKSTDGVSAENLFVGGELGVQMHRQFQYVDLKAGVSLAAGATRQKLSSSGQITSFDATEQTVTSTGWLAEAAERNRTRFSIIPTAEFGLGFRTRWGWNLNVGYTISLWTNTLRATDQVAPSFLPGPGGPSTAGTLRSLPGLEEENYLAHGISLGLERRW